MISVAVIEWRFTVRCAVRVSLIVTRTRRPGEEVPRPVPISRPRYAIVSRCRHVCVRSLGHRTLSDTEPRRETPTRLGILTISRTVATRAVIGVVTVGAGVGTAVAGGVAVAAGGVVPLAISIVCSELRTLPAPSVTVTERWCGPSA